MMHNPPYEDGYKVLGAPLRAPDVGQRLDTYLAANFRFFTRAEWQRRIAQGELLVNRSTAKSSSRVKLDDRFYMYQPQQREPDVPGDLELIYCDAGIAAVSKPPGLPMHEGGAYRYNTFAFRLSALLGREWSAVHRLDKETSGLVICANTEWLRRSLAVQLREGQIRKEYRAIVKGVPATAQWFVDAPLGDLTDSQIRIKNWVVDVGGQPALTEFMRLETGDEHALIAAYPRTGRTNQIRIHAAYSGFPLVGDKLFHPDESVFLDYWENGDHPGIHQKTGHQRCCLHAYGLSFFHPERAATVQVYCDPPLDFMERWDSLSHGNS